MKRLAATGLLALGLSVVTHTQSPPPIRGFAGNAAAAEREAERKFQAVPSPDNLREYMRTITAEPHHAGSPNSKKVADYVLEKFKSWGLDARLEEFEALMPFPTERVVELVGPDAYTAKLQEPPVDADPDSADQGQLPSFNAYSADGDVTADLVYVNYGIPEDYEQLAKLGIDVKGKIAIARYGRSWRGIKPKSRGSTARSAASSIRTRETTATSPATPSPPARSGPNRVSSAAASWTCRSTRATR